MVYLKNLLCSENSLTKIVGYQQPPCLCVRMVFVVETISLSCELFHWRSQHKNLGEAKQFFGAKCLILGE